MKTTGVPELKLCLKYEFMIKYGNLLFDDINLFNKKLDKYLRWYNFERVHAG